MFMTIQIYHLIYFPDFFLLQHFLIFTAHENEYT